MLLAGDAPGAALVFLLLGAEALAYGANWAIMPAVLMQRFGPRVIGRAFSVTTAFMALAVTALASF